MLEYDYIESMISGDLMPHKITENLFFSFHNNEFIIGSMPYGYRIYSSKYYKEYIDEIPSNENDLANVLFENKVYKHPLGQIWYPPTKKAYYFLIMIEIEKSKIMYQYKSFYNDEANLNNPSIHINKEVRRINVLAAELKEYANSQLTSPAEFVISNPIHYIVFLLQETLIDSLSWLYKMYNGLFGIKVINPKELQSYLFDRGSTKSKLVQDETREKANKLFKGQLLKIYEEFKDDIFELESEEDNYEEFCNGMFGNTSIELATNTITKFNYLLHSMWDAKKQYIKKNMPGLTKRMYFEPILTNFKCEYGYFKNKQVITDSLMGTNLVFKNKVDSFFK